jgi:hypothetical protein
VNEMSRSRRWLVPGVLVLVALVLLAVGVVEWRMKSTACPANAVAACVRILRPHRHHPLRAELLWAGAALVAIIAAEVALLQRRRGSGLY